jgi:hypothetical protein
MDPIPPGYRATWGNRCKLGVAKLADHLKAATAHQHFAALLLRDAGDRAKDEFIEVHIYGMLNEASIAAIAGSTPSGRSRTAAVIRKIKDLLKKVKRPWIEI